MKKIVLIVIVLFYSAVSAMADTYHYCNPGLGTGDNDGSSWDNAWRSFADIGWAAIGTEAGAQPVYLYLKKGSTSTARLTVGASGSSDTNRIFITTDQSDTGANPVLQDIDRAIVVNDKDYVTLQNIIVTGSSTVNAGIDLQNSCTYINVDFANIHDINTVAIKMTNCQNCKISNSSIYNIGGSGENTYDAILGGGPGLEISNNIIYNVCEDAIGGGGADGTIIIDGNDISALGWSTESCAASHPDAWQGSGTGIIVRNNYFHDLPSQGIFLEGETSTIVIDVSIYNNIFYNIESGTGAINIYGDSGYMYVFNNTFSSNTSGAGRIEGNFDDVKIYNNIIYNQPGFTITDTGFSGLELDYNNTSTNSLNSTGYASLGLWQAALGGCSNTGNECNSVFQIDPLFTGSSNFSLTASSPMINAGTDLSTYFTTDILGHTRPQGSAWDIGAYEYVSKTGTASFRAPQAGDGSMQRATGGTGSITY